MTANAAINAPDLMFVPITKVDVQKREVWGRATQEVIDSAGEIMDYQSSAPLFRSWSEKILKNSQGKSLGTLRAMHQPISAGKVINMQFNDDARAIDIGTKVVDDKEWQKVIEGVYTGFSVGGAYAKRWSDPTNPLLTRFTADPSEISLVDTPAVPTALFAVVKADGTTEMRKFQKYDNVQIPGAPAVREEVAIEQGVTEEALPPVQNEYNEVETGETITAVNPASPETAVDTRLQAGDEVKSTPADWVAKMQELMNDLQKKIEALSSKQEMEKAQQLEELRLRGSRVGIARREGERLSPAPDEPTDPREYADPANWMFKIDPSSIAAYNKGLHKDAYSLREWFVLGRRLARMAYEKFGATYTFNAATKQIEIPTKEKTMNELNKADLQSLLAECHKQLTACMDLIGSEPDQAKGLLMQALAAMDVATSTEPASKSQTPPTLNGQNVAVLKSDAPAAPEVAKSEDAEEAEEEEEVEKASDPVAAATTDAIAKMQASIEALTAQLTAMTKQGQQAVAQSELPVLDLNGIVAQTPDKPAVIKAIEAGNLQKALEETGGSTVELYQKVQDAAVRSIFDTGINVQKYGILNIGPLHE